MKNKELKREIADKKTGINYTLVGDYYLTNLVLPKEDKETKNKNIGKYGLLRLDFLKEHKRGLYQELLIKNQLHKHLVMIDNEANNKVKMLINQLSKEESIDENLKATDQLKWVQEMNNIKNRAEEIVLKELIYD